MFTIEEYKSDVECKTLSHSANVFHEALKDGEKYYHVVSDGIAYDLIYKGNTEWFEGIVPSYVGKLVPEYLEYNEYDKDTLDLDFLNYYTKYIILKVSEYSIALARAVLMFTDKEVYAMDPRALWFLEKNERLHIGEMPTEDEKTVFLVGPVGTGFVRGDKESNKKSDIFMFHSMMYFQYMLDGKKKESVKYMAYPLAKSILGIGGLLIQTAMINKFANQLGLEIAYSGDTIGKFKAADLHKYFKIDFSREDASEENTAIIESVPYLNVIWRFYMIPATLSSDILQDSFHKELEEYTDAIIANRKSLGVLIRGTDYKAVDFKGSRVQASVEQMLPTLKEWMDNDNYEVIFLATEDQDVLDQMRQAFGKKVVAIAQERHSVSEFKKGQIINELEKQIYSEEEYDAHVVDTTINYFYALYLLSKCDSFMCSGQNNGWDTVRAMNAGKFEKAYRFQVSDEQ